MRYELQNTWVMQNMFISVLKKTSMYKAYIAIEEEKRVENEEYE